MNPALAEAEKNTSTVAEDNHDHRLSRWFAFAPIRGHYLPRLKTR